MNTFLGHAHGIKDEVVERLDTIAHKLEEVRAATDALQKREEQIRINAAVNGVPTGGMLLANFNSIVPAGYLWELQRISTTVKNQDGTYAPGNPICEVFLDTPDPSNLLEVIGGAQLYAEALSNNGYAPENRLLVARFTQLPATNTNCTIAIQIKQSKLPGREVHGQYSMGDW